MIPIRTIGHSNHPVDRFVALLKAAGVAVVIDVRSTPWSRRFPQYGRERLAEALAAHGIGYRHEGAALGGRPAGPAGGGPGYEALAARPAFGAALDRLLDLAGELDAEGRDRVRVRLLELFEVIGRTDPVVLKARRRLSGLLF